MKIDKLEEVEKKFRQLEKKLLATSYPENAVNKKMSLVLGTIKSFEIVVTRFRNNRKKLQEISIESSGWWKTHPKAKSRQAHPDEEYVHSAIRVDVESLFVYGLILVQRTLLLIFLFLPDKPPKDKFEHLTKFYHWLNSNKGISPLAVELKTHFADTPKWLYAVLRFYRNEFIEHMDRSYQQGMGFSTYGNGFQLSSYKWNYSDDDTKRISEFKRKLIKRKVIFPTEIRPRQYVQFMFDRIVEIPEDLLEEALLIIEDVGGESPEPEKLIAMVQAYLNGMFDFLISNFDKSELAKYPKFQKK
ncbi:MAG: hypothetical protein Q8L01_00880 [Candidatus Woesebacteria bacterium]|nr:hypothetical protein [Candidatus Woesebacteria bacterium]